MRFSAIVVVSVGTKIVGLFVDEVSDVADIQHAEVQAPPEFGAQAETRFIAGLVHVGERLIVLLSLDTILRDEPSTPLPSRRKAGRRVRHDMAGHGRLESDAAASARITAAEFKLFQTLVREWTASPSATQAGAGGRETRKALAALRLPDIPAVSRAPARARSCRRRAASADQRHHHQQDRIFSRAPSLRRPSRLRDGAAGPRGRSRRGCATAAGVERGVRQRGRAVTASP